MKSPEQDRWERGENDAYYMRVVKRIPEGSVIVVQTYVAEDGSADTVLTVRRLPWWAQLWRKVKR